MISPPRTLRRVTRLLEADHFGTGVGWMLKQGSVRAVSMVVVDMLDQDHPQV
ncbi:hypothetical protein [Acrocarpospora pleiomorpha]|uniref:hypothetical protein n=1 Tax=Acrocarpospora pleiomorpha TaxID=90975 RepID=UPI001C3FA699|nr:hypothetical protein [Acrocarpospora pleiomorpha]